MPTTLSYARPATLSARGKFAQFALGVGIGSLPVALAILTTNPGLTCLLYLALGVLSFIIVVREPYKFVGFGILAALLAEPIVLVSSCIASLSGPRGPQGVLPPAHAFRVHAAAGAPMLARLLRLR